MKHFDEQIAHDLREFFQIDPYSDESRRRPWWWFRGSCMALLDRPDSRFARVLAQEMSTSG